MEKLLIFSLAVTMILLICFIGLYVLYKKLKTSYTKVLESYELLNQLNSELRRQRHDYLNHCQIIYGMVELEEYEELKEYVEPMYQDLMKTGKALKTSIPALNALLRAKMAEAEQRKIDFYVEVKSDLSKLMIESWELCKILSNLIDNGMTALEEKEGNRILRVDITETKEEYIFRVTNNGPKIPGELRKKIFQEGFTTKTEKNGHGMGLSIVAKALADYGGKLDYSSTEEETCFSVSIYK